MLEVIRMAPDAPALLAAVTRGDAGQVEVVAFFRDWQTRLVQRAAAPPRDRAPDAGPWPTRRGPESQPAGRGAAGHFRLRCDTADGRATVTLRRAGRL